MQIAARTSPRGTLVTYAKGEPHNPRNHECVTRAAIAQKLAALLGYDYAGEHDAAASYRGRRVFLVPNHTIIGVDEARALGIRSERDFFGGVVPHEFVATKVITHPVLADPARVPEGWSAAFAEKVRGVVLQGYSAFSAADAREAGRRLLQQGSVRVKPSTAVGGRGQTIVTTMEELGRAVDAIPSGEMSACGVVVEENLVDVATYSVGRVVVDDLVATYCGTQTLTRDHAGLEVYGGSKLTVARGEFDVLLALPLPAEMRLAVERARVYDAAADRCFEGFIASRRNYDVASGVSETASGRRCGVLEQSWRIGGASGAEVAALEWFREHPSARTVRASCFEVYGEAAAPRHATVHFDGVDEKVGRILKYTVVEPYVDA